MVHWLHFVVLGKYNSHMCLFIPPLLRYTASGDIVYVTSTFGVCLDTTNKSQKICKVSGYI